MVAKNIYIAINKRVHYLKRFCLWNNSGSRWEKSVEQMFKNTQFKMRNTISRRNRIVHWVQALMQSVIYKLILNYSWIGRPIRADKNNSQKSHKSYDNSKTTVQGESRPALTIFVKSIFDLLFFETSENRVPTKIVKTDLDSSRRIFVCRDLRPFWGASVRTGIIFLVS